MHISLAALPLALLLAISPVHAQDRQGAADAGFYQVRFTIQDTSDPAIKAVRNYSLITAANRKATFHVGDRVPVATGSYQPNTAGVNPLVNTQFTYIDIGVNIECTVANVGSKIAMHGDINLSAVERHDAKITGGNPNPTVGQTKLELDTAVDPGKPTVVASIDDPVNMRKLQVEATVTRIN